MHRITWLLNQAFYYLNLTSPALSCSGKTLLEDAYNRIERQLRLFKRHEQSSGSNNECCISDGTRIRLRGGPGGKEEVIAAEGTHGRNEGEHDESSEDDFTDDFTDDVSQDEVSTGE